MWKQVYYSAKLHYREVVLAAFDWQGKKILKTKSSFIWTADTPNHETPRRCPSFRSSYWSEVWLLSWRTHFFLCRVNGLSLILRQLSLSTQKRRKVGVVSLDSSHIRVKVETHILMCKIPSGPSSYSASRWDTVIIKKLLFQFKVYILFIKQYFHNDISYEASQVVCLLYLLPTHHPLLSLPATVC